MYIFFFLGGDAFFEHVTSLCILSSAAPYGSAYSGPDAPYPPVGQNVYGDGYGMPQVC